ncbi:hypothetical protein DYBT9623_01954 [Dyadobacter sp. CECT 9623]|uniref:Uncharacterized protein n=1 Tax=Dyadobacter linearis TaxID=2823330 RepID=A0ABM8UP21_9BACT|nr:hypothetical protein [Dyadobacter sp. CECT 9623]CAG5069218.1 hypothetical protein DYBT9623_01954 [Dyadobacter sp. CECT 9623]
MKKYKLIIAVLAATAIFTVESNAQSIVDPGVSVHNYKHPNKAAQAKTKQPKVQVATINTVERNGKFQRGKYMSTTPKYAPRPATLVVVRDYKVEGIEINPLLSPRNYKTPNLNTENNRNADQMADYVDQSKDSVYPTTD